MFYLDSIPVPGNVSWLTFTIAAFSCVR